MKSIQLSAPQIKTSHAMGYDKFKFIDGNRKIYEDHVRVLAKSYQRNPELIELRPVLINENWEIVDGQHRMLACKMIAHAVPYIQMPGLTVQTAQLLNATQKSWQMRDFLHSYAVSGLPEYQFLQNLFLDYKIPLSNVIRSATTNTAAITM